MIHFALTLWQFIRAIRKGLEDPEFQALGALVLIVIGSGTLFYHRVEDMTWIDALYFCVITLTTVGYGDISPHTAIGKLFTIVYIFVGLGLLAAFISYIAKNALAMRQPPEIISRLRSSPASSIHDSSADS